MSSEVTVIRSIINGLRSQTAREDAVENIEKYCPATGEIQSLVVSAGEQEVAESVKTAQLAFPSWSQKSPVERSLVLRRTAQLFSQNADQLSVTISRETGKSRKDAHAELEGAIEMAYFVAGEGRRLYGKSTTSAVSNRQAFTLRQPLGVVGLIVASNTPIANIAWKLFPALVSGNTIVLKASENTPQIAEDVFWLVQEAGLPNGVLNLLQGSGKKTGKLLVEHQGVSAISFTGSSSVGKEIASASGLKMQKVCLELGGKNPFVICDDAELVPCTDAAVLSAFSNAGQRCAAASRIIVFEKIYDQFISLLLEKTKIQSVGPADTDDFGPVIHSHQVQRILSAISNAEQVGAKVLIGGKTIQGGRHKKGFYLEPTLIENTELNSNIATTELFGPVATIHKVENFEEAIQAANLSPYGLTAALWTNSIHKAQSALTRLSCGVVSINGPTYGSEPHMPFGGLRDSGNGWREAGTEAIDFYTEIKTAYINHFPDQLDA